VPTVPRGLIDQTEIRAGINRAENALAPDVMYIRYSLTMDWMGDQSLFFRIVLSNAASSPKRLRETTQHIIAKVLQETNAEELGIQTYFNFRSHSEQAMLPGSLLGAGKTIVDAVCQ
jgi:hypothetical protein